MKKQMTRRSMQAICFLLMITTAQHAFSQKSDTGSRPVKTGDEWRMPGDAVKRAKDFASRQKKALNLDDATTQKLFQAWLGNTKSVDEIRVSPGSDKQKADKLKANRAAFDEGLKKVLSPAEFAAYMKNENAVKKG